MYSNPAAKILYFVLFCLSLCRISAAQQNDTYLSDLEARARSLALAEDPAWLALLHKLAPDERSEIASSGFFFAPNGSMDAGAELDATLKAFTAVAANPDESAQCLYPARFAWLNEKLHFDPRRIAKLPCPTFTKWHDGIAPAGLTLVFPSTYLNNPASAFGHTLLRIDVANETEERRLLTYTANFAADTNGSKGFAYAIKGTFGGFYGYFAVIPYYRKITQYSDLEHRDIWEYKLNFTRTETEQLVRHLWELRGVPFVYYYFDQNCSYNLLSLIDVARPSLRLEQRFHAWVIPIDTLRELQNEPGLVGEVTYRPSEGTILHRRIQNLPLAVQSNAKHIVSSGALAALPEDPHERAQTLELAYDFLRYEQVRQRSDDDRTKRFAYDLLRARSAVGIASTAQQVPVPETRPDEGHKRTEVGFAFGSEARHPYYQFEVRPAYHGLLDPSGGYVRGSELELMNASIRQREGGPLRLQRINAIGLTSLVPSNYFMHPISWQFALEADRERWRGGREPFVTTLALGAGKTYGITDDLMWYLLAGPRVNAVAEYDSTFIAGAEGKSGFLYYLGDKWTASFAGEFTRFWLGDVFDRYGIISDVRYALTLDRVIRVSAKREQDRDSPHTEIEAGFDWFF